MLETVKNSKKLLSYRGKIDYDKISSILADLKGAFDKLDFRLGTYKKVLTVLVECLENIYKYLDNKDLDVSLMEEHLPYFHLMQGEDRFVLEAGNLMMNKDIDGLKAKIDKVNDLERDDLKALYRQIITNGQFTTKGGAGLGFIEMVKTTKHKINYVFDPISADYSFFHIQITIPLSQS